MREIMRPHTVRLRELLVNNGGQLDIGGHREFLKELYRAFAKIGKNESPENKLQALKYLLNIGIEGAGAEGVVAAPGDPIVEEGLLFTAYRCDSRPLQRHLLNQIQSYLLANNISTAKSKEFLKEILNQTDNENKTVLDVIMSKPNSDAHPSAYGLMLAGGGFNNKQLERQAYRIALKISATLPLLTTLLLYPDITPFSLFTCSTAFSTKSSLLIAAAAVIGSTSYITETHVPKDLAEFNSTCMTFAACLLLTYGFPVAVGLFDASASNFLLTTAISVACSTSALPIKDKLISLASMPFDAMYGAAYEVMLKGVELEAAAQQR